MARQRKPRVITNCVASHSDSRDERTIEYSHQVPLPDDRGSTYAGGLITFREHNGTLIIELHNHEGPLEIRVGSLTDPYEPRNRREPAPWIKDSGKSLLITFPKSTGETK